MDATAETERRRPGRPRKAVSREQSVNMRRERNRRAQRSFRLRQQITEKERKQQSDQLENAIDQIVSIFLACTDHVMNSEWARHDSDLINKLRQSIQTMHSLLPETRGLDVNLAQRDGHRNSSTIPATVQTPTSDGNESSPEDTAERDVNIRRHSVSMPEETMHASLESGRQSKPVTTSSRIVDGNVGFGSYIEANVIDSQWMSQTSWLGNEPAPMLGNPESLDSPFSLQVTISTLKHGYDVLLSATNATEPSIIRVFGIAMQRRSREQLLLHLRWLLGPGILELGRLCKANFNSSDAAVVCNADQVAKLVRQRSIRSLGNDVIELSTNRMNELELVDVKPLGTGPGSFYLCPKEGNSWKANNNHQRTAQTIQISMGLLLRNIAHAGFCLITGPAFTMEHLEKAINASVI